MILNRAGTNTPSDAYDSYRAYRVANTNMFPIREYTFFSEAINVTRQCSKLFHTVTLLTNLINLIETNY